MDLRKVILLIVLIGHATAASRLKQIIQMLTNLQRHVISLEEQQTQMKENLKSLEGKLMEFETSLTKQVHESYCKPEVQKLVETSSTLTSDIAQPQDCAEIYDRGMTQDGVYTIFPNNGNPVDVYCINGSIVLTRRFNGSLNFNRTMEEYSVGFGDPHGEYWIGLNWMHEITKSGSWTIQFDLEDFDADVGVKWAIYENFQIGPAPGFKLLFDESSYRGNEYNYNAFGDNHGMDFTTRDCDQDRLDGRNCATINFGDGGWWYDGKILWNCGLASTTGMPYGDRWSIKWGNWGGLKAATMHIKRI